MNILFTNFCNRSCPYCFAKEKLILSKPSQNSYISFKNIKIIIDFLRRSKITQTSVIGGEPTLHPQFKRALAMVINHGLFVTIFSNGLIKKDIVLFLKGLDVNKWKMVLNINAPQSYIKKEWFTVNRTAEFLGKQIILNFNIYQSNFDMDFMIRFIQQYNIEKEIRLRIAMPIFGGNNQYVEIKEYPKVANNIVEFVEKNYRTGISINFDCGLILCSFTDTQLGKLFRFGSLPRFYCCTPIDVGPDLELWSCFPTSMLWNRKLTDFKDANAIGKFYYEKFKYLRRAGATDKCLKCEFLELGQCAGGCLGHILKSFKLEERLEKFV